MNADDARPPADALALIAVNRPVFGRFHYTVPDAARDTLRVGCRVSVPFGHAESTGVCVGFDDTAPSEAGALKPIHHVIDAEPLFTAEILELAEWMARYYLCPLGEVLASFLPSSVARTQRAVATVSLDPDRGDPEATAADRERRAPKQAALLRYLAKTDQMPLKTLRGEDVFSDGAYRALLEQGWIRVLRGPATAALPTRPAGTGDGTETPLELTPEQREAVDAIDGAANTFAPFLLHGVTGSGKTEVYLQAIARRIDAGEQAIVLVPEIALTPQTVDRFRRRFRSVAVLHSALTPRERSDAWLAIRRGEVDVTIGPRSAVLAPCPRLGILVVDEEHEPTFKQQNAPRYHARDIAVKRAHQTGVPVVLGSATPSIESYHNASTDRYRLLRLPERVSGRSLPSITVVDLASDSAFKRKSSIVGQTLQDALSETLVRGEQALLFLNRRGFHTVNVCRDCSTPVRCPNCDLTMTFHKGRNLLACHACEHRMRPPTRCPECQSGEAMSFYGLGTERVEEIVAACFPDARIERMDSDTMTKPESYRDVLARFRAREIDVLVGTQMIAKGLHFPGVTLVGVISADTALGLADFRAAERTFQLLTQVAGRAGRGDAPGRVIVQTLDPGHYAITAAQSQDFEGFAAREIGMRERYGLPPFMRLLRITLHATDEAKVRNAARACADLLEATRTADVQVLGPAPAPIFKLKNRYRFHALVKAPTPAGIQRAFAALHESPSTWRRGVSMQLDVDPQGLA